MDGSGPGRTPGGLYPPDPEPAGLNPAGMWSRIQASTAVGWPGAVHHRVAVTTSGVAGGPELGAVSKGDVVRPDRTAPGGVGKDAMMCAASAVARWRGEPTVGAARLCAAVTPAGEPACWVPQPASTIVAHAAALMSEHGTRCRCGFAAGGVVMPL